MNYRHLQFFIKVVQQGSIKAAADQLGVSQPTISAAIRNLEKEFDAKLLDRRREGSVPTVYGRALYDSAITLNTVVQNAHEKIADLRDPARSHLRIGTGPSVSIDHVSEALAEVARHYPDMRISHVGRNSYQTLEQLLIVDDIDVALCHVPAHRLPETLDYRLVSPNPIVAVTAASHLPAGKESLSTLNMLADFRWITPRDDEIRRPKGVPLSQYAQQHGPPISLIAQDLQLIKNMTLATKSISFLPRQMVEAELTAGQLVELVIDGIETTRPIYALTRQVRDQPPVVQSLLDAAVRAFDISAHAVRRHRVVSLVREPAA
ncbi:MAG: LysR family transcriptional regulator [Chromatiales bacterium]|nr:MAG: LysR family transcriptional regulator [Chromatiales bacterium]